MIEYAGLSQSYDRNISNTLSDRIDKIVGGHSFSGADYTAVVFLPISRDELNERKKQVQSKITQIGGPPGQGGGELTSLINLWTDLSKRYNAALQAGNAFLANTLADQIRKIDVNRIQRLRELLDAYKLELKKLNSIQINKDGQVQGFRPVTLGNLQTLSISSHRDKRPVRGLGRVYPKSYVRGPRTIAGSLIFTIINEYALAELVNSSMNFYNTGVGQSGSDSGYPEISTMLVDQLPPFDITIIGSSEYGDNSFSVLYGVELVNDGVTMSIQDLVTECVMQFVARDYDPLRPLSERVNLAKVEPGAPILTADNVVKQAKSSQERRNIRLNPFV